MDLSILSPTLNVPDLYSSKVTTVSFTDSTVTKKGNIPLSSLPSFTTQFRFMPHNQRQNLPLQQLYFNSKKNNNTPFHSLLLSSPLLPPFLFSPTFDWLFFSRCASSTTSTSQSMDWSTVTSTLTNSYDVSKTWNLTGASFYCVHVRVGRG